MRKYLILGTVLAVLVVFSNCHSAKKAQASKPKLSYEGSIQTLIAGNCSPCHIPSKGGNKLPLDSYASVKENIDDMIRRIELEPGARGFMPFKHAKLSDSTIAAFKQWRDEGLLEK